MRGWFALMAQNKRKLDQVDIGQSPGDIQPRKRSADEHVARAGLDPKERTHLRIQTDSTKLGAPIIVENSSNQSYSDDTEDVDSLFDEPREQPILTQATSLANEPMEPARRTVPPIPGLFFSSPILLPPELANVVMQECLETYFPGEEVNQVMLFGRAGDATISLPPFLTALLPALSKLLQPILPPQTHALLFPLIPTRARQVILNLYQPGEGITPHVDLLGRFGDGIIGVSLGSGCVMRFDRTEMRSGGGKQADGEPEQAQVERWELYLPERSIIVLSGDARYEWAHGIERRAMDFVERPQQGGSGDDVRGEWLERSLRLSITFRWLLPGAEVVGESGLDI